MLRSALAIIVYFLIVGEAHPGSTESSSFLLSSNPEEAAAFHYLRGRYYFLGFTPLKLSKKDLDGKSSTRILLTKFGYDRQLFDLDVDDKDKSFKLNLVLPSVVVGTEGQQLKHTNCKLALEKRITNLVQNGGANQINVQLPVRWVETNKGSKIVAIVHILNRNDIVNIKKAVRKNKDTAISQVEELIRPLSQKVISNFKDLDCLNRLLLIAVYKDKGIKIDFTPYRDYWTARSEFTIGNTTYVTTAWGSTIELQKNMLVTEKEKSFLFEYRLN